MRVDRGILAQGRTSCLESRLWGSVGGSKWWFLRLVDDGYCERRRVFRGRGGWSLRCYLLDGGLLVSRRLSRMRSQWGGDATCLSVS